MSIDERKVERVCDLKRREEMRNGNGKGRVEVIREALSNSYDC